jgi:hypothetical protein
MVIRVPTSSKDTRGLKGNINTKLAITPHRPSTVMARQVRQEDNWKLGQTHKTVHKQFQFNLQEASVNRRSESLHPEAQQISPLIYIQCWSIIKNSVVEVSNEREINAFTQGLRRADFVEEMGRIKPKILAKLMDVANRFTDGEDTYQNKRTGSPEDDRLNRYSN